MRHQRHTGDASQQLPRVGVRTSAETCLACKHVTFWTWTMERRVKASSLRYSADMRRLAAYVLQIYLLVDSLAITNAKQRP